MATTKFKMPTDKQIWAEVDKKIAEWPEVFKKVNRFPPDRNDLFAERKAWHKDTPKRIKEGKINAAKAAKEEAAKKKQLAAADAAYIAIRRSKGKPIITVAKFKLDYPQINVAEISKCSQQKLHETYEWFGFVIDAKAIQKRYTRLQAATKALTYKYLAQTYGLYRRIVKSEAADTTFDEIRAMLWNDYKIKTHFDIPRSSLLLKLVFEGALEKTIHLYSRSFQLAEGYDVEEADFTDFIKKIGGMEKIRKAYATVIAADAGNWRPAYIQDAEYSASRNELRGAKPFKVVELERGEGLFLKNDILNHFCLILAHIDPMGQLELYSQLPANNAITNDIIKRLSDKHRKAGTPSWLDHKAKATALSTERLEEKLAAKAEKLAAKEKKTAAAAKKKVATAKRFAKKRASQTPAKPNKVQPVIKTKVAAKKK